MPKTKKSRPNLRLYIVVAVVALTGYALFRYLYPAQEAPIFVVTQPLEYGDVTLTGTLRKDAPLGEAGNYYLVLSSGATIALDSQGLDGLTNAMVTATGYLTPADGATYPNLAVRTITIAN